MIRGRVHSPGLGVAAVLALATAVGYGWLLGQQEPVAPISGRVVLVAATIVALGLTCGLGAFTASPGGRAILAAIATGGLVPLGLLGIFSVGLPLLVAGLVTLTAGLRALPDGSPRTPAWAVAGAIATAAILALGFLLT